MGGVFGLLCMADPAETVRLAKARPQVLLGEVQPAVMTDDSIATGIGCENFLLLASAMKAGSGSSRSFREGNDLADACLARSAMRGGLCMLFSALLRKFANLLVGDRPAPGLAVGDTFAVGEGCTIAAAAGTTGSKASPSPILLLRFRMSRGAVKRDLAENLDLFPCSGLGEPAASSKSPKVTWTSLSLVGLLRPFGER